MKVYKSEKARERILDSYDRLLALWDTDTVELDIPTTYGTTHVILCGDREAPPLVLFHGVGDDSALMWLYNAKTLARRFRVFAVDTIGGPGKSRPNENYNKDFDDARWIDEVLAGLELGQVYMAGVSHGSYLTQHYGLHRPDRVIKMVCLAGTVPAGDYSPLKIMMKIFLPEALFPTKRNTAKLMRKLCGKNVRVFLDHPIVMEHYQHLLKGFHNMSMRFHKIERFTEEQTAAIRDKTLYLMGEEDPFARLGGKDALVRYAMDARFFPRVGHGINHEISEEINKILAGHLLPAFGPAPERVV
jgi:pimeloyl-ACP methyl ester carboxylesterase